MRLHNLIQPWGRLVPVLVVTVVVACFMWLIAQDSAQLATGVACTATAIEGTTSAQLVLDCGGTPARTTEATPIAAYAEGVRAFTCDVFRGGRAECVLAAADSTRGH